MKSIISRFKPVRSSCTCDSQTIMSSTLEQALNMLDEAMLPSTSAESSVDVQVKTHKCDNCGYTFTRRSNLNRHIKRSKCRLRNVNEGDDESSQSSSSANSSSSLDVQDKAHTCSDCGYAFTRRKNLKRHIKRGKCRSQNEGKLFT